MAAASSRRRSLRVRIIVVAAALAIAIPASSLGVSASYVDDLAAGVTFTPLINSGDAPFGDVFEGLPDGIGVVPGPGKHPAYVDLYVNHEQSHVPFGLTATNVYADGTGPSDPHDSSVTRVRVNLATKSVIDTQIVLPGSAGFIRFCSATVVGPKQGFKHYTLLLNEESNDILPVPIGATYGPDTQSLGTQRQAGYTVYLDLETGKYGPIAGMGRHNHENQVLVPGHWDERMAFLSGDDTFSAPGSQLYMYVAEDAKDVLRDRGHLYAFQVTKKNGVPVDRWNAFNAANDYLDIAPGDGVTPGDTVSGRFIRVPDDIARGKTADPPQTALENWSNLNNIFQFIRVEDIQYDPDSPRTIYFADTGSTVQPDSVTGRMKSGGTAQRGRIFKMALNRHDPRIVDSLTVLADGNNVALSNFIRPDNLDVGHNSIMVQEDNSNSRIWKYSFGSGLWNPVAIVDSVPSSTNTDPGESSGIIDMSPWLGDGWWALDVQAHQDVNVDAAGSVHKDQLVNPASTNPADWYTWSGGPLPPGGAQYRFHRENGQLLFMYVPGS